jgi:hypothetical protein
MNAALRVRHWMRMSLGLLLAAGAWCVRAPAARADAVTLASGRVIHGIVLDEDHRQVRVQVAWRGFVTLDRAEVAAIWRGDDAEHERLRAGWQSRYAADQRQLQARDRQAQAEQRAREARETREATRRLANQRRGGDTLRIYYRPIQPIRLRSVGRRETVIVGRASPPPRTASSRRR